MSRAVRDLQEKLEAEIELSVDIINNPALPQREKERMYEVASLLEDEYRNVTGNYYIPHFRKI
jgi:hypothetical protein